MLHLGIYWKWNEFSQFELWNTELLLFVMIFLFKVKNKYKIMLALNVSSKIFSWQSVNVLRCGFPVIVSLCHCTFEEKWLKTLNNWKYIFPWRVLFYLLLSSLNWEIITNIHHFSLPGSNAFTQQALNKY